MALTCGVLQSKKKEKVEQLFEARKENIITFCKKVLFFAAAQWRACMPMWFPAPVERSWDGPVNATHSNAITADRRPSQDSLLFSRQVTHGDLQLRGSRVASLGFGHRSSFCFMTSLDDCWVAVSQLQRRSSSGSRNFKRPNDFKGDDARL